jgi:hypothetical protein
MTTTAIAADPKNTMQGARLHVIHSPYASGVPSSALRTLTLIGYTGDVAGVGRERFVRYVLSLPPRLRAITPDVEHPPYVLQVRRWSRNGALQGATTAHLVPAVLDPATGQYKLQERVAAGGNSATFSSLQVVEFIGQIVGRPVASVNIHDYDLDREQAHHKVS